MGRKANPNMSSYREAISRVLDSHRSDSEHVRNMSAKEVVAEARKYLPNDLRSTLDASNASVAVMISQLKRPITGGRPGAGRPRKSETVGA